MNNFSVGKYMPGNSVIHKLNPRVKLLGNILLIVLVFLAKSFLMEAIIFAPILLAFLLSKIRYTQLFQMLKPVIFIGLFIFVINIFIMDQRPNDILYAQWWKLDITYRAISQTLLVMLRIYCMIVATTILTATTKQMGLTRAIEDFLWPLKLIRVPVAIIAMIIAIALRFIPTLLDESQRIMKAQASRGVDFKNGNIKTKTKAIITLIIPLFVSAFAKAEDLGNAMETRHYDPYEKRTRYRVYPLKFSDIVATLILVSLTIVIILVKVDVILYPSWWR